jgi:hypothetical protein
MTLVLTVIAPFVSVQVSDRRLVWYERGRVVRRDDQRNKAVLWRGRSAFAYTGLARLGRERRTDMWLANRLAEMTAEGVSDHGDVLSRLAEASTRALKSGHIRPIPPQLRRHAFVATGWARFDGEERSEPYVAYVSNYHRLVDEQVTVLGLAEPEFNWFYRRLEPDDAGYVETLGGLARSELSPLIDQLKTVGSDAVAMIDVLVGAVREESRRRESVGRGVMVNVLPRSAIPTDSREFTVLSNVVAADHLSFVSLSHNNAVDGSYGPVIVGEEAIFSDFRATAADGREIPFAGITFDKSGFGVRMPQGIDGEVIARIRRFRELPQED